MWFLNNILFPYLWFCIFLSIVIIFMQLFYYREIISVLMYSDGYEKEEVELVKNFKYSFLKEIIERITIAIPFILLCFVPIFNVFLIIQFCRLIVQGVNMKEIEEMREKNLKKENKKEHEGFKEALKKARDSKGSFNEDDYEEL